MQALLAVLAWRAVLHFIRQEDGDEGENNVEPC